MITALQMSHCVVFHSYLRIEAFVYLDPHESADGITLTLEQAAAGPAQGFRFVRTHANGAHEMALEALVDRVSFPHGVSLRVRCGASTLVKTMDEVIAETAAVHRRDALTWDCLRAPLAAIAATGRRPRLLDLGGRRRSGIAYTDELAMCDVTVFDIVAGPGVDVTGDAHALSRHFAPDTFDAVMCNSVFEHLLMPWKVAIELGRVMRTGGLCYIHTHQTLGMHDMPWDFWRFSDQAWAGLFNARTGFEIVTARMSYFSHVVTAGWTPAYTGAEASGGFEASGVLVRRIGASDLDWDVTLAETIATEYPK